MVVYLIGKRFLRFLRRWYMTWKVNKWIISAKDKLVLHTFHRCQPLPSFSHFGVKLETYLRMAKIPYEIDTNNFMVPKGKMPSVTYKGKNVADSQLTIEFLNKEFGISINTKNTPKKQLAAKLRKMPSILKSLLPRQSSKAKQKMRFYQMMEADLHTASAVLGSKRFFGGDEPCDDDCGIFGLVAQAVWGMPGSSFERLCHDLMGPHGKMPWVTYNGENIADSQLIIEFLNKEFRVSINASNISKEQLAAARACRIVMEDHFLFGIMQYRVVDNINSLHKLMKIPTILKPLLPIQLRHTKQKMVGQGIGAHSPEDIYQMTEADLYTASAMLGSKRFFGGDEPCDDDCGIFGLVAQAVWGMPGSSFERLGVVES
ncbi:hypothetical protein Ocin01_13338 [Orchesella cincta]|uniref:Failed axon connections n=1 Tax=Orchesella cincta TaxID=48709 RepID=A0A1D2MKI7_ORCCI|nr:hypothetical protein Ocin01_13338 [Orchesella cincta]